MAKPKAAIFDIGATLVTGPPVAPNKVIAALLDGVSPTDVASVIMTTDLASADEVCAALEQRCGAVSADARLAIRDLWDSQLSAPVEIPGATDTVLALKRQGMRIGLLSDIWNPYYAGVRNALPAVIDSADGIVLSCRTGARKPNPDNFLRALEELDVRADEAVMIGDTYSHDILPALTLGMRAVWVLARPEREAEHVIGVLNSELPSPTVTVCDISEVSELPIWG